MNLCGYFEKNWPYVLLLAQALLLFVLFMFRNQVFFKKYLMPCILGGMLIFAFIHLFKNGNNRRALFDNYFMVYSPEMRMYDIFGSPYKIAEIIKDRYPQAQSVALLSDEMYINLSHQEDMVFFRPFRYLLFPKKVIANPETIDQDILLCFFKKSCLDQIPKSYKVIESQPHLLVAIKEYI